MFKAFAQYFGMCFVNLICGGVLAIVVLEAIAFFFNVVIK